MARAEARRGHADDALTYYHRAIYGTWDGDAVAHSTATRVELIEQLVRRGPSRDLLAELLLLEQSTDDPAIVRRVAGLYLDAGAPDRAIDAWERLLRTTPRDPSIHVGLGEAQLAAHRYRAAYASFRAALRLAPDDARPRRGLALASDVQSLDPTARGLDERGRYARSVTLLEGVRAALERCAPGAAPGPAVLPARLDGERPSVDATERNLDEAERLWRSRGAACNSPDTEALDLVVAGLGQ
jgi:tetratricopeptide (TPR) repeat protein